MRLKYLLVSSFLLLGCTALNPGGTPDTGFQQSLNALSSNHHQAVVVRGDPKNLTRATVQCFERKGNRWSALTATLPAVIGRNGFAPADEKKEGDGRTPSGVFEIGAAFGYAPTITTGLDYFQATHEDLWVDDVASEFYNQRYRGKLEDVSHERLKRDDDLYSYAAVIEYNTDPIVKGAGSAIFLHVWRGEDKPTSGCIALSKQNVKRILRWLKREQNPVIILGKQ